MRRRCQNPECGKTIEEYKNAKKIYCNDHCRNRAGYINRSIENKNLIDFQRGLKNNSRLLKQFVDNQFERIHYPTIKQLGFDLNYFPIGIDGKIGDKHVNIFKLNSTQFYYNKESNEIVIIKN